MFSEVADELSKIRRKDFTLDFGPAESTRALKTTIEDPATFSSSLKEKLKENQSIAEENLKKELDKVIENSVIQSTLLSWMRCGSTTDSNMCFFLVDVCRMFAFNVMVNTPAGPKATGVLTYCRSYMI